jgi:hypothetical protein
MASDAVVIDLLAASHRHRRRLAATVASTLLAACGGGGDGGIEAFDAGNAVVAADFDGDGGVDIAMAVARVAGPPPHDGAVRLWLQEAGRPGFFGAPVDVPVGPDPWVLRVADLDGDGVPDLVAMSSHASADEAVGMVDAVTVLRGDPSRRGRFLPAVTLHAGARLSDVAVTDLDGDGCPDIAFTSYGSGARLGVWWNDPSQPGRFASPAHALAPIDGGLLAAADLDADGLKDLAVTATDGVLWLRRDPSEPRRFAVAQPLVPEAGVTCIAAADLDRDGRTDLLLARRDRAEVGASGELVTLRQGAAPRGMFAPLQRVPLPLHANAWLIADLDGNGWPDVAGSGAAVRPNLFDDAIEVLLDAHAASAGAMSPPVRAITRGTASGYHLSAGDLEGDGRPELLMPSRGGVLTWRLDPTSPGSLVPGPALP